MRCPSVLCLRFHASVCNRHHVSRTRGGVPQPGLCLGFFFRAEGGFQVPTGPVLLPHCVGDSVSDYIHAVSVPWVALQPQAVPFVLPETSRAPICSVSSGVSHCAPNDRRAVRVPAANMVAALCTMRQRALEIELETKEGVGETGLPRPQLFRCSGRSLERQTAGPCACWPRGVVRSTEVAGHRSR